MKLNKPTSTKPDLIVSFCPLWSTLAVFLRLTSTSMIFKKAMKLWLLLALPCLQQLLKSLRFCWWRRETWRRKLASGGLGWVERKTMLHPCKASYPQLQEECLVHDKMTQHKGHKVKIIYSIGEWHRTLWVYDCTGLSEPLYSSAPNVLWASACTIQSLLDTASRLFLGSQRTNWKHYVTNSDLSQSNPKSDPRSSWHE